VHDEVASAADDVLLKIPDQIGIASQRDPIDSEPWASAGPRAEWASSFTLSGPFPMMLMTERVVRYGAVTSMPDTAERARDKSAGLLKRFSSDEG